MARQSKAFRYKGTSRKRSKLQKIQSERLPKENNASIASPPLNSAHSPTKNILRNSIQEKDAEKKKLLAAGHNLRRKLKRREVKIEGLEKDVRQAEEKWQESELNRVEMEKQKEVMQYALGCLREQMNDVLAEKSEWKGKISELKRSKHALTMRVSQFDDQKEKAISRALRDAKVNTWRTKEKGEITESCRALIRDLASAQVGVEHMPEVIKMVAEAFSVEVDGSFSVRSAGRAILEGGVAGQCQTAENIQRCEGLTVSGNGTTIKNINYESHHINFKMPDGSVVHEFAGVTPAVNHQSQTQMDGWKELSTTLTDIHNEVFGDRKPLAYDRDLFIKSTGGSSDHSEDQKKLFKLWRLHKTKVDLDKRGEETMLTMTPEESIPLLLDIFRQAVDDAGGFPVWTTLSHAEKKVYHDKAYSVFREKLGKEKFDALTEKEKSASKLFLWVGCGMHKELNAFKGGVQAMKEWWEENKSETIIPPRKLMNRDNRVAAESGSSDAASRAESVSKGGAIKLTELAGSVLRHKDNKKGQQDTVKYYAEHVLGIIIVFPDTSNIRYFSHGDASSELLVNQDFYTTLLEMVRDKKATGAFTNVEENVYVGLSDNPTITELCVVSLYSEAVSHPLLRCLRGPEGKGINAPDLGPFYARLVAFIERIINDPDILLSPTVTFETGTFDGKPWHQPEVIYSIHSRLPHLPLVRPLLVAYFSGTLTVWKRFIAEFSAGGEIDRASSEERARAPIPVTNDCNEGRLGGKRCSMRMRPNMSHHQHNARALYKGNNVRNYIAKMDWRSRTNLKRIARKQDASQAMKKFRLKQACYDEAMAGKNRVKFGIRKARADKRAREIENTVAILDITEIDGLGVKELDRQFKWHRAQGTKLEVGIGKKTRDEKRAELKKVVSSCSGPRDTFIQHNLAILSENSGSENEESEAEGGDGLGDDPESSDNE